jgi:3-oxoacyl-[acyl-carrier-protein] synthase II
MRNARDWQRRRVVITGMGVVAPNGLDLETFWRTICEGKSGADKVTRFSTDELPYHVAAEVKGFDPTLFMDAKTARRTDLATQYSIAAAHMAVSDARLETSKEDVDRIGLVEGAGTRGLQSYYDCNLAYWKKGYRGLNPFDVVNSYNGEGIGKIAVEMGVRGHAVTISSGSASSNDAIGYGASLIQEDDADIIIAGGTDEAISEPIYAGFSFLRLLGADERGPAKAMRPYDRSRNGFLIGEGSAYVVLEELGHALDRGAKIYAELLGHGRTCEAFHQVNPHPDGLGVATAIEKALRKAALLPDEIDYVNTHGTATPQGDIAETRGLKRAFARAARIPPVSSTKPITGHWLAGSGAVETIVCALALQRQVIPPTTNLEHPDAECDLDYVVGGPRAYPLERVLNINIGFGGKNSCLVLARPPESR